MPAAAPARRGLMHISRQIPALCPFFSPIQPLDRCQQAGSLMSTFPKTSSRRSFSASPAQVSADKSPSIVWTTHKLSPEQVLKVDKIFHKILWLDIFESSMLTELVNEKLGLVMTKKQRRQLEARMVALEKGKAGGGGGAAQKQEEEEAKPALVDVKLIAFDAKQKIKVIKEVRGALELGLKEAKALVEGAPVPLQKGMQPEAAAELKSKLEGAGATIELVDA